MSVKIGINGFGRIGQAYLRILSEQSQQEIEVVAINDIAPIEDLAYSLKHDSLRGSFPGEIGIVGENILTVNGRPILVLRQPNPAALRWADAGVEIVVEATGALRGGDLARQHITHGGAKKVLFSASADSPDVFVVYGVSDDMYDPTAHTLVSPSSCGVNALAVLAKPLVESFGLRDASSITVLAAQGWQKIHDSVAHTSRHDPRMGRSAALNIIPHLYVRSELLPLAVPLLGDVMSSVYVAPVPIGSMVILDGRLERAASAEAVNKVLADAAAGPLAGILGYAADPSVSSDAKNQPFSCMVDPTCTVVMPDGRVRVTGWFDGEWGFGNRLVDLTKLMARSL